MSKKEKKEKGTNGVRKVMNILGGSFLVKEQFTKQFPFMVYVTVLLMIIITNTYIAEDRSREIVKNTKLLNDLHVEYIQVKSSIMQASKQSVLARKLRGIGLKDPVEPLKRINIDEEKQPETEE
ncbi:MAG: hypothetical protein IJQ11_03120 [Bacteroidales bacterium]|nr:hypothetical protein [Bacteroidales bacterium]